MMKFVNNVKISVKYFSEKNLTHFSTAANERKVCVKHIRNFLTIKDVYSITIFKQTQNKYHFNVTGIKSLAEITNAISWLERVYCRTESFDFISWNIDNITSSFNLGRHISLHNLANIVPGTSYNPERFHALYLKTDEGTIVVFQSGKINILGCKSLENIVKLWTYIRRKINAACSTVTS